MKWLIILALILAVFGLIALRYRRQIQMAFQVWQMFRTMKKTSQNSKSSSIENSQIPDIKNTKDSPLVRCAKCSKWVPENVAINFRKQTYYCSANCIEVKVKT